MLTLGNTKHTYYYYAYCHYNLGDHVLSGYYFNKFAYTFPNSKHVEESQYMSAYCQFLNSGDYLVEANVTARMLDNIPECSILYGNMLKLMQDCI